MEGEKKKPPPPLSSLWYISLWKPKSSSNIYSLSPIANFASLLIGLKKVGGMG